MVGRRDCGTAARQSRDKSASQKYYQMLKLRKLVRNMKAMMQCKMWIKMRLMPID